MRRWPRVLGRLLILAAVLWIAYVVTVFSYGERAPGAEIAWALLPPLFLIAVTMWIAEAWR
jgi:hypothetical protein